MRAPSAAAGAAAMTTLQQLQRDQHRLQAAAGAYDAPPASRWAARKVVTGAIAPLHGGAATISTDYAAAGTGAFVSVRADSVDGQRLASVSRLHALSRAEAAPSSLSAASSVAADGPSSSSAAVHAVAFCVVPRDSISSPGEVWVAWSNGKISVLGEAANKVLVTLPSIAPTCGAVVALLCFYAGSTSVPLAAEASVSGPHTPAEGAWLFGRAHHRAARSAVVVVTASGTLLCIDTRSRSLLFRVPPLQTPRNTLVRCACALADDSRAILLLATEDCFVHAVELTMSSSPSSRSSSPAVGRLQTSSYANRAVSPAARQQTPTQQQQQQQHCNPRVLQVINVAPPNVQVDVECAPMCMSVTTPFLRDPTPTVFIGFLSGHATFCRIVATPTAATATAAASSRFGGVEYMVLYNAAAAMTAAHDFNDPVVAVIPIQHGAGCITVSPTGACVFAVASLVSGSGGGGSAWTAIQRIGGFYPSDFAAFDGERPSYPIGGAALGSNEAVLLLSDGGLRRLLVENPEPPLSPQRRAAPSALRSSNAQQQQQRGEDAVRRDDGVAHVSPRRYPTPRTQAQQQQQALLLDDSGRHRSPRATQRPVSPSRRGVVAATTSSAMELDEEQPSAAIDGRAVSPISPSSAATRPRPTQPQHQQSQSQSRQQPSSSYYRAVLQQSNGAADGGDDLEEDDFLPMEMLSPSEGEPRSSRGLPRPTPRRDAGGANAATTAATAAFSAGAHGYWGSASRQRGGRGVATTHTPGVGTFTSTIDQAMHLADCVQRHYVGEALARHAIVAEHDSELGWMWHLHRAALQAVSFSSSASSGGGGGGRRGDRRPTFLLGGPSGGGGILSAEHGGLLIAEDDEDLLQVVDFFALQQLEADARRKMIIEEFVPSLHRIWHCHAFESRFADLAAHERRNRRRMLRDEEEEHHLLSYLQWSTSGTAAGGFSTAARIASPTTRRRADSDSGAGGDNNASGAGFSAAMLSDMQRQLARERSRVESLTREGAALGDTVTQLEALLREEQRRSDALKRDLDSVTTAAQQAAAAAAAALSPSVSASARRAQQEQQDLIAAEHRARLHERHRALEEQLVAQRRQLDAQMDVQRRIQAEQEQLRASAVAAPVGAVSPRERIVISPDRPASRSAAARAISPPRGRGVSTSSSSGVQAAVAAASIAVQADLAQPQQHLLHSQQEQIRDQQSALDIAHASTARTTSALAAEMAALRRQLEDEQIRRGDAERLLAATQRRLDQVTSVAAQCEGDSKEAKTAARAAEERVRLLTTEVAEVRADLAATKQRAEKAEGLAAQFEAEFKLCDEAMQRAARERDMALQTTDRAVAAVEEQAAKLRLLEPLRRASKKLLTACDIAVSVGSEPPAFATLRKFMRELQLDLGSFKRLDVHSSSSSSSAAAVAAWSSSSVGERMGELQRRSHEIQEQLFSPINPTVVVLEKREAVAIMTELRDAVDRASDALGQPRSSSLPASVARGGRLN